VVRAPKKFIAERALTVMAPTRSDAAAGGAIRRHSRGARGGWGRSAGEPLAAIGLGIVSLVTLDGISHSEMVRQVPTWAPACWRMLADPRASTTRDCAELKWGLYVNPAGASWSLSGRRSIGGVLDAVDLRSVFSFQGSEVGKCC